MRRLLAGLAFVTVTLSVSQAQEPQFYMKAHIDEACSCKLFCPCYFNPNPDGDRCNFNNVFSVEKGHYGTTSIDGLRVWLSGNLAGDLSKGFEGVIAAFEPDATPQQIEAFKAIAVKLYVLPIQKFVVAEPTKMTITHAAGKHVASRADDKGHVVLTLPAASSNDGKNVPAVQNLKYFGATKNNGFNLYHGTHRFKGNGYDYSYTKRNGFTIDIEIGTPPAAAKKTTTSAN